MQTPIPIFHYLNGGNERSLDQTYFRYKTKKISRAFILLPPVLHLLGETANRVTTVNNVRSPILANYVSYYWYPQMSHFPPVFKKDLFERVMHVSARKPLIKIRFLHYSQFQPPSISPRIPEPFFHLTSIKSVSGYLASFFLQREQSHKCEKMFSSSIYLWNYAFLIQDVLIMKNLAEF